MQERARWIAQTGIFLALLVVAQIATRPFGNQILTGSLNNMLFILAVMLLGLSSATVLAVVSPVLGTVMGVGPLWPFIPVIIAGNIALIVLWHFIRAKGNGCVRAKQKGAIHDHKWKVHEHKGTVRAIHHRCITALIVAAIVKFLILYFGIVRFIVPLVLGLEEPQASVVSAAFSWPQIITASIGGVLALLLSPALSKTLPKI